MNILIVGGTRFFGISMIKRILENGHNVTIDTRENYNNIFNKNIILLWI